MISIFKKKSSKNGFFGVIDVLIAPVLMIIATPILLRYLGVEDYAVWALVNSVVASLSLFNFAGTNLVIRYVSLGRKEKDPEIISQTLSTVFVFQAYIAIIIYALYLILSLYFFSDFSQQFAENITILYFAIPLFFTKQFEQLLYAFFKGYEEYNQVAFLSLFSKTVFFSAQAIAAVITNSVHQVFLYALIASIIIFIIEVIYIKSLHKHAVLLKSASYEKAKSLINFGSWNWLSSIASTLQVNSDKWMVTAILGVKTFGYYSLGILIFNQLSNIISASVAWVFPKISVEGIQSENLIRNYYYLTSFIVLSSYTISIILNNLDLLFELWLGINIYSESKLYINLFLIMLPVYTLPIVSYYYLLALDLAKNKFFVDISVLAIKILSIYLMISLLSFEKWPLSFLVFISIQFIFYTRIVCKNLKIKNYPLLLLLIIQILIVSVRVYFL